jgi:SAM-dependent methyltransferase
MLGASADPFTDTFVAMTAARGVIAATRLGVLGVLAEAPASAEAMAERLELDVVGVEALLTALDALGYVDQAPDGTFTPTEVGLRLAPGTPGSIADFIGAYNADAWEMLSSLEDALQGHSMPASHQRPPGDPFWEAYICGLHELTRDQMAEAARLVDIVEPKRMLDLGGGHAGFAIALCALHPRLQATVLDLPASAAVGRKIVAAAGLEERIAFREGDATQTGLGEDLDVVSMFNLLHHLPAVAVRTLLARARGALDSSGRLVIGETERTERGEPANLHGAISGLVYFASSGTRNYTRHELTEWIGEAGFASVEVHRSESSPWRLTYVAVPGAADG